MSNENIIVKTPRCRIRKFTKDDLSELYNLLRDKDVMKYYPYPMNQEQSKKWLNQIMKDYDQHQIGWWAVESKEDHTFMGQAGLLYRNYDGKDECMLAYMIHKRFWRKGLGTEISHEILKYGFENLSIEKIDCLIRPINIPSIKVAQKLGLKLEKSISYAGYDHYVYVAVKYEWHDKK